MRFGASPYGYYVPAYGRMGSSRGTGAHPPFGGLAQQCQTTGGSSTSAFQIEFRLLPTVIGASLLKVGCPDPGMALTRRRDSDAGRQDRPTADIKATMTFGRRVANEYRRSCRTLRRMMLDAI